MTDYSADFPQVTLDRAAAMTLDEAVERSVEIIAHHKKFTQDQGYELKGTFALFSGGNDSTALTHLAKEFIDAAVHINTGIGIEDTRQYVRFLCASYRIPLIEKQPDEKDSYETLVLDQGFPGPGHHFKMYQRLKERQLHKVRRDFVTNGRKQRIIFLAGRRAFESNRRKSNLVGVGSRIIQSERQGSMIWVSPIAHWTGEHMKEYRERNPHIPRNQVSDHIHMSGECLCGAFAKPGELDEIGFFYPEVKAQIEELEKKVEAAGHTRCKWGAGGGRPSKNSGMLCSSCDFRALTFDDLDEWIADKEKGLAK